MCRRYSATHRGHPLLCILPPHMLREIIRNGTPDQKAAASETLAIDDVMREVRDLTTPAPVREHALAQKRVVAPKKHRTIYDAGGSQQLPGRVIRKEGSKPMGDASVDEAYDGLGATFDFYLATYHRNSIDNAGLALNASVHFGVDYDNAFWNGQQMVFGDGDRKLFNRFTASVDVIGHELTHGVSANEAGLLYQDQAGALNESLSDVFGSLIKQYTAAGKEASAVTQAWKQVGVL